MLEHYKKVMHGFSQSTNNKDESRKRKRCDGTPVEEHVKDSGFDSIRIQPCNGKFQDILKILYYVIILYDIGDV